MQLVLFLGNDFIASIGVNTHLISAPGYMGRLKRQLLTENQTVLEGAPQKPEFLLVDSFSSDRQQNTAGK